MSEQVENARYLSQIPTPMKVESVTLDGQYVRLEPITMEHHAALCSALLDDEIWRWMPWRVTTPDEMREFMQTALKLRDEGTMITFATVYKPDNCVVGTTRYLTIERANHNIEIGGTMVGRNWQRTVVNTEAKYLMLRHAFETLGCLRVQFQTDSLNTKSKNAILRLGATQEGVIRNKVICWDGRIRHSLYFSITDEEWPGVKANLEAKMRGSFAS